MSAVSGEGPPAGARSGATAAPKAAQLAGRRLGRYRLVQQIGEGGMGVVHLAVDEDGRAVAVKVLRPHVAADPQARERLAREVESLRRVRHPRVAEVISADVDCDTPYLVTRYVPASPLDDVVREHGPLRGHDLARLGEGLGEALAAIHAAGVVHRDLKPANVLMLDGDPVVIDFGIAHVADDLRLTSTGLVMGTPGYLSPELVEGDAVVDATDWWGWAATMAFAATGRPPFGRGPLEVVLDRVRRGAADLEGAPAALVPVLVQALGVEPSRRPKPGALHRAVEQLRADADADADAQQVLHDAATTELSVRRPAEASDPPRPRGDVASSRDAQTQVLRSMPPPAGLTEAVPVQPATPPPPSPPAPRDEVGQTRALPVVPAETAVQPPAPRRRGRTGTLLAALVALMAGSAVLPVLAIAVAVAASVVARTVDRAHGMLLRRRYERGPRRGDRPLAVASSPWHLVVAVLWSVPLLVLPLLVSVSTVFLAGLVVDLDGSVVGQVAPLALGAAAGASTAWWGPGGSSLRRGARAVARAASPEPNGPAVAVSFLLALAGGLVVLLMLWQWIPDWYPLDQAPLSGGADLPLP